jgi:hypothetical protein
MKKLVIGFILLIVLVAGLGAASVVYAQSSTAGQASGYGPGRRGGMMNQSQGYGMAGMMADDQDDWMHDAMISAFAEKLGMTESELNSRLNNGETMLQVAVSKGYTAEQFRAMMLDVRTQVLAGAVKDGKITQAQADWMEQHGAGMLDGSGSCAGNGAGLRGMGRGQNGGTTRPNNTPTVP